MTLDPARLAPALARLALAAALAACAAPAVATVPTTAQKKAVGRGAAAFAKLEKMRVDLLSKELDRLVADPALVGPFLARDREKLLAAAKPIFEKLETVDQITHLYFIDPEPARTCFLRVHKPEQFGDVVDRETLRAAIATRKIGFGKELGRTAFALRVVKPIRSGGKIVGYMELAEEIDHFFERMRQLTGDDFGLLVDKQHVDRAELARVRNDDRWDERPEVVLVNSTMWDEKRIQLPVPLAALPADGAYAGSWKAEGRTYVGGAFPVKSASGHVVGALFVRHQVGGPPPGAAGKEPAAAPAR
ncbi:MAG TPA: cache domain-containing protein [Anaeromyxobacter sp.]|nr:cache domain-containing protein [Anaeromyxobacter sp.]